MPQSAELSSPSNVVHVCKHLWIHAFNNDIKFFNSDHFLQIQFAINASGGQIFTCTSWRHLVLKSVTYTSGTVWRVVAEEKCLLCWELVHVSDRLNKIKMWCNDLLRGLFHSIWCCQESWLRMCDGKITGTLELIAWVRCFYVFSFSIFRYIYSMKLSWTTGNVVSEINLTIYLINIIQVNNTDFNFKIQSSIYSRTRLSRFTGPWHTVRGVLCQWTNLHLNP